MTYVSICNLLYTDICALLCLFFIHDVYLNCFKHLSIFLEKTLPIFRSIKNLFKFYLMLNESCKKYIENNNFFNLICMYNTCFLMVHFLPTDHWLKCSKR